MVMLKPDGKAFKIAKMVLANKGVKVPKPKAKEPMKVGPPYLYH